MNSLNNRIGSKEIRSVVNSNSITGGLKARMLFVADVLEDERFNASLKGAFSLVVNDIAKFGESSARKTTDLDFNILSKSDTFSNIKEFCSEHKFEILKLTGTPSGNLKLRIKAYEESIDVDIANSNNGVGVFASEEVAREKLNLKLVLTDRRLKDLIDFMLYIYNYYSEGITKKQLLSMVNDKSKIAEAATKDVFEDCMKQASKFRGVRHPDTYVADFFVLLEGLLDPETTDNMIFVDGMWQYKTK